MRWQNFFGIEQKVIDHYSQVIYIARTSAMPYLNQLRSRLFSMRYCAGKGGINNGD
jgi:hypothetical protein